MKIIKNILVLALLVNVSCGSTAKVLTPAEIKLMTTKQYEEPYDLVYKSVMSLLQSEQFAIESTDMKSGLIVATKNIYEKKKAFLTKSVIIVDKLNGNLTEVKSTVYYGEEKIKNNGYSDKKRKVESMIQDPAYYKKWFTNLFAEMERRKALR